MEILRDLIPWNCCLCRKKPSRYGYSIIRAANVSSRSSLLSNNSLDKPIRNGALEFVEDHQDEIVSILKDVKTSRILLEIPELGKRFTTQLAEYSFHESYDQELNSDKDEILKQNLIYLASHTNHVDRLQHELLSRRVLSFSDYTVVVQHKHRMLKALEIYKLVLKQRDSLGFIVGALKVTGSEYVAEILVGSFPEAGAELICRISLTEAYSPDFTLKGEPKHYRKLREIPRERQEILTSITCAHLEIKGKTLLRSLQHCERLTTLKLIDIKLHKEFAGKVALPSLKQFVLHLNYTFENKADFFNHITPERILSLLFFKVDENNNSTDNYYYNRNGGGGILWNINDIWNLNVDISIKIGGRTVLLVDHVKSRCFSRLENHYKVPENVIQPQSVRNLYLGWCRISKSAIPLHLNRLLLYSVNFVDSTLRSRDDLNLILRNSYCLREFKLWGSIRKQPWSLLRTSCFPPKLKTLTASFVEIEVDTCTDEFERVEHQDSTDVWRRKHRNLENICLFFYHTKEESRLMELIGNCKRVSLSNFPPYQTPTQAQLLELIERRNAKQIIFCGCSHTLNFEEHFLYLKKPVIDNIENVKNFVLFLQNKVWDSKALSQEEIEEHLHSKFSFETLYSLDAFRQHEIISSLWK